MKARIEVTPNGCIEGDVEFIDVGGRRIDTTDKDRIAHCRCGGSTNRPFCDGIHSKNGFELLKSAVPKKAIHNFQQTFEVSNRRRV